MRYVILATLISALAMVTGCTKTGDGQYEIRRPVLGTKTDTVRGPTIETGTVKDTITLPKVTTEKKEVNLPKVKVRRPR
ncbi:MAG TPA: hypothetical protein VH763_19760 [Gemmatimonadales bacterium]